MLDVGEVVPLSENDLAIFNSEIFVVTLDFHRASRLLLPAMRFNWPATKRMVNLHFAVFILLWWGGLNCLSGCLIPQAGANGESHCSMSGEGGACCESRGGGKKSHLTKSIGTPSTSIQSLSCCSLL